MYKILAISLMVAANSAVAEDGGKALNTYPVAPMAKTADQAIAPSITPIAASDLVKNQHAIMIDVREPGEAALVRIPGAINIPLGQLKTRLIELSAYKHSPIITQCRTGRRSQEALKTLVSSGFTQAQNLEGGIVAWEKSGLKIEKKCC